jgi:hypothetical protein
MSIESKIEELVKALDRQTLAMQHSALVMASLIEASTEAKEPKKPRAKKQETAEPVVATAEPVVATAEPVAEAVVATVEPVVEAVVATVEPVVAVRTREVSAVDLRQEVLKLVGSLKTKLDDRAFAEFTTKLKSDLFPQFKTVNGAVKKLDDTNVMDDFERGEFLTAVEKLVAAYV